MIESRYSIEYINPEAASKEKAGKKHYLLFTILGLIIASALAYAILSIGKSNLFIRMTDNTEPENITQAPLAIVENKIDKPKEKIVLASFKQKEDNSIQNEVEKLLQQNEKRQDTEKTQVTSNKELTNSLNLLTQQLMAEREKSKALDRQLNTQKTENSQLSELLENAMSKADNEDKKYLAALKKIEDKQAPLPSKKVKMIDSSVTVSNSKSAIKVDHYNSVNLSTLSQMDAIIAIMQGGKTPAPNIAKPKPKNTATTIQIASIDKTGTDQLQIQLQKQINKMLDDSATTQNLDTVGYKKALEKESQVRRNAVRSITIKKGETLWGIAQRAYGNGSQYKKIVNANPQININLLQEGQVIRVPN